MLLQRQEEEEEDTLITIYFSPTKTENVKKNIIRTKSAVFEPRGLMLFNTDLLHSLGGV
jgi:hypothetical protein